jgi:hypothetical protein
VDCADNDCCSADLCQAHINCLTSPEPQEVLLREQAPPDTASFFDRVRFLIRENGVQSYVDRTAFDPKFVFPLRISLVGKFSDKFLFQASFRPSWSGCGFRRSRSGGCSHVHSSAKWRNVAVGLHDNSTRWNVCFLSCQMIDQQNCFL